MDIECNKKNNKENIKYSLVTVFGLFIVLLICSPFLRATQYALFKADDFSNYNKLMNMVGDNLFVKSINAMKDTWLTWQGTYTSVFLLYFINPLSSFSLTRLRAILFLIVLSCIVGLVLVINMILDYLAIQKKYSIYFLNLLVMPMLLSKEYGEV